jgi:hypothetical protein
MTWWFIVLGFSSLVIVCVAIALYVRVRQHMRASKPVVDLDTGETGHHTDHV